MRGPACERHGGLAEQQDVPEPGPRYPLALTRFRQRDYMQAKALCEAELSRPGLLEPSRAMLLTLARAAQSGLVE